MRRRRQWIQEWELRADRGEIEASAMRREIAACEGDILDALAALRPRDTRAA